MSVEDAARDKANPNIQWHADQLALDIADYLFAADRSDPDGPWQNRHAYAERLVVECEQAIPDGDRCRAVLEMVRDALLHGLDHRPDPHLNEALALVTDALAITQRKDQRDNPSR